MWTAASVGSIPVSVPSTHGMFAEVVRMVYLPDMDMFPKPWLATLSEQDRTFWQELAARTRAAIAEREEKSND